MSDIFKKAPVLHSFVKLLKNKSFDDDVLHQAKRVVADTVGTAYGGIKLPAFENALRIKNTLFGNGDMEIWGLNEKTGLYGAVFYNSLAVSSTDYDEGHRKAVGHPASVVVPVAIALGEYMNLPFEKILKSVITGYEAGTRFSYSRKPGFVNSYSTGRWGALAAAATVSYLLDFDEEQMMHALSLAFISSPSMQGGSTDVSTGSMAKEGVIWAAQNGLQSALLSKEGFTGPYLFIDAYDEIDKDKLLENPDSPWLIMSNYFKPYACCRWLHTALRLTIKMRNKNSINPAEVESIEIKVFGRIFNLIENKYPENIVQAQFHMPFVVACALKFGEVSPEQMNENVLNDDSIKALIDKIKLVEDDRFNKVFPLQLSSGVKIKLNSGKEYYEEASTAPWDAGTPPTDKELYEKFKKLTGSKADRLWESFGLNN